MDLNPEEIARKVTANQPHPGVIVHEALTDSEPGEDVEAMAARVLDRLQAHYELRPR